MLAGTDSLVLLRGQWVEVDRARLERTMQQFREAEELAARDGLSFAEAMRMLAGAAVTDDAADAAIADWSSVTAGPWLAETLQTLRAPNGRRSIPASALHGTLRPYQQAGVQWLHLLSGLGLGACLADDMGLGKTIQVLSLLLAQRRERGRGAAKPAGGAGLAAGELGGGDRKIRPGLNALIVHPSAMPAEQIKAVHAGRRRELGPGDHQLRLAAAHPGPGGDRMALRHPGRGAGDQEPEGEADARGQGAEGQGAHRADRNAGGEPPRRPVVDLRFHQSGPAGHRRSSSAAMPRGWPTARHNPYGPLRELVRPYILRRMKTDKSIIADLPDKTEVKAYCGLSRRQAALYEQAVRDLEKRLEEPDGIERRGVVLAMLMRLKQICNHPSQWLGRQCLGRGGQRQAGAAARDRRGGGRAAGEDAGVHPVPRDDRAAGGFPGRRVRPARAGAARRDGGAQRRDLVQTFQEDETVPFFVLSLKAGGSGLTLTAASHVVHFDRWWNPAVENQATDRAFRIGQKQNVLVHKFVCRGTVEEKIDALIELEAGRV